MVAKNNAEVNNDRRIYRVIDHAVEHIKNGDKELAINLLQAEMEKDRKKRRKSDRR